VAQEIEFGHHWIVYIGSLKVHMDTLIMAWLSMVLVIVFSLVVTGNLSRRPGILQTFAELVMEFIESIPIGQMGKEGYKHIPLIGSLFLFILTANLVGQLPWKLYHLKTGELASPTNDINVTAALALIVSVYYFGAGIAKKGFGYFKHYFQPMWFMAPFNLLEDFTRPLSLSVRLFANILAGEIIVMVLIGILPLFLPIPIMLFELFVAFIQAFIFAVLAASYVAHSVNEEH
jgi:F-type H+-transporting ATPase subunit a